MRETKKQKAPSGKKLANGTQPTVSNPKQETAGGNAGVSSKIWDDERFAHLINDPRYRGMPKSKKKVQIDSRFKAMFEDGRFTERATVDRYGRKLRQTHSDEMKKFYELEESDDEDEEKAQRERELEERAMEGRMKEEENEKDTSGSDSESTDDLELNEEEKNLDIPTKIKKRLKNLEIDYARGEGVLLTESSSDDDSDEGFEGADDDDEVFIEHVWGELDADAERTEDSTKRLAVCNMDWDRIRAVDIMVLLNSFLTPGSTIKSVAIYPSEFGKERMQEEETRGPQELTSRVMEDSEEEADGDEESQKERLREYQLNRLKYYYAVVECDTVETADKIYKECDGVEYESTANKIDLRFIPDDMEFNDEPKDLCSELPDMSKYVPRIFTTSALTQAKVELTWDENDPDRKEFNEKIRDGKWAQMPESELKKYVVCSSSDEEADEEEGKKNGKTKKRPLVLLRAPEASSGSDEGASSESDGEPKGRRKEEMIAKYKALLNEVKEQSRSDDKVEMEFTWKVNDDGKDKGEAADSEQEDDDSDGEGQQHQRGRTKSLPDDVNPFEKILQKKKEKAKRRKELKKRRKRGQLDGSDDGDANEDDSSDDDTPYGVDLNDPFFASAFDENEFDLGKKKKNKKKDREAIQQSKEQEEREAAEEARRKAELELLLDDGEDNRAHFNLRAIQESEIDLKSVSKAKRRRILKKSKQEIEEKRNAKQAVTDDFEVNVEDDRFGAIFSKAEYNIDPTNPAFKKTKGMDRLIEHKLKKRRLAENDMPAEDGVMVASQQAPGKQMKKDVATTMLVKSIKRKIGKAT
ncbi:ESF1 homolog [Anopheles ziemanni]|uniref:ESF1 homolog n=1 Tax=Anopheles coustani TaxID=139045 RepID=UPI002657C4E8|nr:ESF1 homolog [Anopheles coustani]XP_058169231.1 ESF1 homolog [Anopheles ziemanni]